MFNSENNCYWRKFSELINAQFVEGKYWHSAQTIYDYKGFKIIFDNYTLHSISGKNSIDSYLTRIYVLFICDKRLHLRLQEKSVLNRLLNVFNFNKFKGFNPLLEEIFIITSNEKGSLNVFSKQIVNELFESNIKYIFIDNNEGIWGGRLGVNQFELAAYIDTYNVDYSELYKVKKTF